MAHVLPATPASNGKDRPPPPPAELDWPAAHPSRALFGRYSPGWERCPGERRGGRGPRQPPIKRKKTRARAFFPACLSPPGGGRRARPARGQRRPPGPPLDLSGRGPQGRQVGRRGRAFLGVGHWRPARSLSLSLSPTASHLENVSGGAQAKSEESPTPLRSPPFHARPRPARCGWARHAVTPASQSGRAGQAVNIGRWRRRRAPGGRSLTRHGQGPRPHPPRPPPPGGGWGGGGGGGTARPGTARKRPACVSPRKAARRRPGRLGGRAPASARAGVGGGGGGERGGQGRPKTQVHSFELPTPTFPSPLLAMRLLTAAATALLALGATARYVGWWAGGVTRTGGVARGGAGAEGLRLFFGSSNGAPPSRLSRDAGGGVARPRPPGPLPPSGGHALKAWIWWEGMATEARRGPGAAGARLRFCPSQGA